MTLLQRTPSTILLYNVCMRHSVSGLNQRDSHDCFMLLHCTLYTCAMHNRTWCMRYQPRLDNVILTFGVIGHRNQQLSSLKWQRLVLRAYCLCRYCDAASAIFGKPIRFMCIVVRYNTNSPNCKCIFKCINISLA